MKNNNFIYKKHLGQHFLIDNNIINKIINNCPNLQNMNVIEVGPGYGNLTKALLPKCKQLVAIEKDQSLIYFLEELKKKNNNFQYYIEDASKTNYFNIAPKPKSIIANLPYNIGTYLFTKWLPISQEFNYFILMFQKEVALRITSNVNKQHYGRLSLFTKLYGNAEILLTVNQNCFKPKPLVESAVIKFTPYNSSLKINKEAFIKIVKTAFLGRRKTIKTSLKHYNFKFTELGINPQSRPENLTFEQFVLLSKNV